jgi:hypothetical protein
MSRWRPHTDLQQCNHKSKQMDIKNFHCRSEALDVTSFSLLPIERQSVYNYER